MATFSDLIPLYTYTNLYDRYDVDTMDGFTFYSSTIVQSEEENQGKDEIIPLDEIIPPDHMKVLSTLIQDGVPPETILPGAPFEEFQRSGDQL